MNQSCDSNDGEPEEDLTPRLYQSQMLDLCYLQNSIVFLPTGSGKTYIAVMLIKRMATDLERKFSEGGKRSFFLVNTVALAEQQKDYISRHTHLSVGHYTGDMNVDYWEESLWHAELDKNQVLVMTGQIFLDILRHSYISLASVNLLVFDECHHAVNDHFMSKIMEEFDNYPLEGQPRVLGLTATLLNSSCKFNRVDQQVKELQKTFHSRIAPVEDLSQVESFSTNPCERCIRYADPEQLPVVEYVRKLLTGAKNFVSAYEFEEDKVNVAVPANAHHQRGKKTNKKLANKLSEVELHVEHLGIFGGSIATVKQIMQLERLKAKAEDEMAVLVYMSLITTLSMIRKLLEDEMEGLSEETKIYKYSSQQVLTLLEVLKQYKPIDNGRALIFVERRFTAKILYNVLKAASESMECYKFITPEFVVGFHNNPFKNTREGALERKWNREAIEKFQKGLTNVLVASDVLEEGIDIPQCTLVIRFDLPKSYRSYVQSKGRARHKNSNYVLLFPRSKAEKLCNTFEEYRKIEQLLKSVLTGGETSRNNEREEISEDNTEESEFPREYTTNANARVTYASAIPLVNRYCSLLPQDKFTRLVPNWFLMTNTGTKFQVTLQLPMNSSIKKSVMGHCFTTKKNAKRSAAFLACIELHKVGELDDHLLPVGQSAGDLIDEKHLFSVYNTAMETENESQPGTKKCRRPYAKKIPSALCGVTPTSEIELYLHIMEVAPAYEKPLPENTRKRTFYEFLQCDQGYAILSSSVFPELCDFSIYMNVGKVDTKLKINHKTVKLTDQQIAELRQFHTFLFFDILVLYKSYITWNLDNNENAFLVVPVKRGLNDNYDIDWTVVKTYKSLPVIKEPKEEHLRLGVNGENWNQFEHTIVVPWYRGMLPDQMYVVTQICTDMSPVSEFPTTAYSSFDDYFNRKYGLTIKNLEQPLFEVKAINNRLNCLIPRNKSLSSGRSKRQDQNEDFEEHLVPELCVEVDFPANLWLKAICLPSCLHRICHLLMADELRREIAEDLNLPQDPAKRWESLKLDSTCLEDASKPKPTPSVASTGFKFSSMHVSEDFLLGSEEEPVDIDRERLEDVTLMDILYFHEYVNKPLPINCDDCMGEDALAQVHSTNSRRPSFTSDVPEIKLLKQTLESGPELCHILQALTCACSNDALNLERLETLGDSFLKYSSTLFLFLCYPKLDEGKLTRVKGKIVGNRNLYYCGRNRNIIGKMKYHEFTPKSDWLPPGYSVPGRVKKAVTQLKLNPSVLFDVEFKRHEQESGHLSTASENMWQDILANTEPQQSTTPSESLIGMQSVPDKMVADSVEALIGAYLTGCGLETASRLLGWLKILPEDYTETWSQGEYPCSAFAIDDDDVQSKVDFFLSPSQALDLEKRLGYTFNNRGYLLQAMSHASYAQNRVTECYQRLEFLGDAILDFLITCHIYEKCNSLTPGELTDLRSALVNNITFGSLAVRYGFQKFCLYDSSKLFEKVDTFVKFQQTHNFRINEDVLLLLGENDEECEQVGESVDVPKVLGDLFESLAGAIYLDSGKSLQTVWEVYYRLMKTEIEEFSICIPKQPVRMLYELCTPPPIFQQVHPIKEYEKVMVELEVVLNSKKCHYYGVGENKSDAKRTAAKLALRAMQKVSENQWRRV